MKRVVSITVAVVVLIVFIAILTTHSRDRSDAPRFLRPPGQRFFDYSTYDFLGSRPFENGRMWVGSFTDRTNLEIELLDIERRQSLGRVTNGWPAILFGDPPELLTTRPLPVPTGFQLWQRAILQLIARLLRGEARSSAPLLEDGQTYWLLDLEKDSATRLGDIPGPANYSLYPSPDFHYCFTLRQGPNLQPVLYLLDLRQKSIKKLQLPAHPCDWWDGSHLLLQSPNADFLLYDLQGRKTSPLVSVRDLATLVEDSTLLTNSPGRLGAFAIWNGHENDFYVTDLHRKWLATNSFLVRLERPRGTPRLVARDFKFGWSDHLDPAGRLYLYSGREAGQASDGVFLRDVQSGSNRVLVPGTTNPSFSLPRFYRDSVIYMRSNVLWRISLDGSNNIPLFSPGPSRKKD